MDSRRWLSVLVFLLAPVALAQSPSDPEFWRSDDVRTTDSAGFTCRANRMARPASNGT